MSSQSKPAAQLPLPERLVAEAKAILIDAVVAPKKAYSGQPVLGLAPESARPYYALFRAKAKAADELSRAALEMQKKAEGDAAKAAVAKEYNPKIIALGKQAEWARTTFWATVEETLSPEDAEKTLSICAGWEVVEASEKGPMSMSGLRGLMVINMSSAFAGGPPAGSGDPCPFCGGFH